MKSMKSLFEIYKSEGTLMDNKKHSQPVLDAWDGSLRGCFLHLVAAYDGIGLSNRYSSPIVVDGNYLCP
jgi:hypothetical protein